MNATLTWINWQWMSDCNSSITRAKMNREVAFWPLLMTWRCWLISMHHWGSWASAKAQLEAQTTNKKWSDQMRNLVLKSTVSTACTSRCNQWVLRSPLWTFRWNSKRVWIWSTSILLTHAFLKTTWARASLFSIHIASRKHSKCKVRSWRKSLKRSIKSYRRILNLIRRKRSCIRIWWANTAKYLNIHLNAPACFLHCRLSCLRWFWITNVRKMLLVVFRQSNNLKIAV